MGSACWLIGGESPFDTPRPGGVVDVVARLFGRMDSDRNEAGAGVSRWLWKEDYCAGEETEGEGEDRLARRDVVVGMEDDASAWSMA